MLLIYSHRHLPPLEDRWELELVAVHRDADYVAGNSCCNFRLGGCYGEVGAGIGAFAAGGLFQIVVGGKVAWALEAN